MKLQQAETIAKNFLSEIKEFCERIEIAGSIRRKKPEVNDINIILIPRQREHLIQGIRKIFHQKFDCFWVVLWCWYRVAVEGMGLRKH